LTTPEALGEEHMVTYQRRDLLRGVAGAAVVCGGGWSVLASAQAPAAPGGADELLGDLEVISTGHTWSEGPLWVGDADGYLLFSDVPANIIHRWDGKGARVFLQPSGYAGPPQPQVIREGGSNGLALGRGGLLIADSGNRCISVIDLQTKARRVIVDRYEGKRLNSPNDLVVAASGDIYFTDPPHGLVGGLESPHRELAHTGVYRLTPDNQLHLITDALFPNGVALSPDGRTLYSTDRSGWVAIDLDAQARPVGRRLLIASATLGGGGDGMKTDRHGNLWFTGPGGVHVYAASGKRLGLIPVAGARSNCAFGPGGHIYITSRDRVLRGRLNPAFLERISA
jgi:gluconolactonase